MIALKTRSALTLLLVLAFGAAALTLPPGAGASPRAGAPAALAGALSPSATIQLEGHGYGHGRGMGQYGALGYAINYGWSYQQILAHYYSNAQAGTYANAPVTVRLTALDGATTVVTQELGGATVSGQAGSYAALEAVLIGPNQFQVYSGPAGCSGGWTKLGSPVTGPVVFSSSYYTPGTTNHQDLLQACVPGGTRWYRGQIESVDAGGMGYQADQRSVNKVLMEEYLLGVVPSESPASWGSMGSLVNGQYTGMNALEAQAVAARSYAAAQDRYSYAQICDSTACQVYGGMAYQDSSGFQYVESPNATTAVQKTAGQDLTLNGVPASAEYSASTGGYTAGGTFPAVPDDGDSVSVNPYHTWTATLVVSDVEGAFPSIGALESIQVTQRNGLGDFGGRVLSMELLGTQATLTISGDLFAAYFNLRSNWFRVVIPSLSAGGYWVAGADGGIFDFGSAGYFGSTAGTPLTRPIVGMAATADSQGYYLVATDGGIFSFGDAAFMGSTGSITLNQPIVGMAIHTDGASTTGGYWMVASDGGIFSFGDAHFYGSTGSIHLNRPIVGMAVTPDGGGYWLVASDGGIFSFGDAHFYGSTGSIQLNKPIVGMAATPDGGGYWLVASDGGVFSFGDAAFYGSTGSIVLSQPITGMQSTADGLGYYMVARDGGIFAFGDAPYFGSVPQVDPGSTTIKVGMARSQ